MPTQTAGQQATPQQIAAMQAQIGQEATKRGMNPQQIAALQAQFLQAAKRGMTPQQYFSQLQQREADGLKQHVLESHQKQQQQKQAAEQSGQGKSEQQVSITPGAPDLPKALALAKWMRGQDLKTRTCILDGRRRDMFRVKRALRALQSPTYTAAASKKNSLLPPVTPEQPVQEIFRLLSLSFLVIRVSKADPHEGHDHGSNTSKKLQKRVKGLWHVKVEHEQENIDEDLYYVWRYEGPQWKQKLYAAGALAAIMAVVMFPLWPIKLRLGVWYLSMGVLGLIGLFALMSIFRLILFCITYFAVPPGLWLYPNLFEDVGFFDSFKPVWGWQEGKKKKKKSKDVSDMPSKQPDTSKKSATTSSTEAPTTRVTSTSSTTSVNGNASKSFAPGVEEVDED